MWRLGGWHLFEVQPLLEEIWYSRKKKREGGRGLRIGISGNSEEIASGISKHVISRIDVEKTMWNFERLK